MKRQIFFSMEKHDYWPDHMLDDIGGYIFLYATDAERGVLGDKVNPSSRHPAIKAMARIRGNQFTADDVQAVVDFMPTIYDRAEEKAKEQEVERDLLAPSMNTLSHNAYQHIIDNLRDAPLRVRRSVQTFQDAFQEALDESAREAA